MIILRQPHYIKEKAGIIPPEQRESLAYGAVRQMMAKFKGTDIDKMLLVCDTIKAMAGHLLISVEDESVKMSKELATYVMKKKKFIALL